MESGEDYQDIFHINDTRSRRSSWRAFRLHVRLYFLRIPSSSTLARPPPTRFLSTSPGATTAPAPGCLCRLRHPHLPGMSASLETEVQALRSIAASLKTEVRASRPSELPSAPSIPNICQHGGVTKDGSPGIKIKQAIVGAIPSIYPTMPSADAPGSRRTHHHNARHYRPLQG